MILKACGYVYTNYKMLSEDSGDLKMYASAIYYFIYKYLKFFPVVSVYLTSNYLPCNLANTVCSYIYV